MMRIGLITGEYPPMQGGVADFSRELALAMAALGHEVFVLTDRRGPGRDDQGIAVGARVKGWNWTCLTGVRRWARSNRLDVVNVQYQAAAYRMAGLVHLLPRWLGDVPAVTTFHDLRVPYLFPKAGELRSRAVLALARASTGVVVTSHEDERQLSHTPGMPPLRHIPIGSNIHDEPPAGYDRSAWRERLGVEAGETLVGYFGFLNQSKGVETLLQALARANTAETPARLLMIGGRTGDSDPTNAAYAQEIDALIDRLGLADRVSWTGYVDSAEVGAHLRACDCVVLPYRDGVSFRRGSLMAALAHGCPIVTTAPSVFTPELIHEENVFLVAPGSATGLAVALRVLVTQPDLRRRLSEGARALAEQFAWDRIAGRTVAFFEDLLT